MSVPVSTLSVLAFGFGLGLKHAMEADHLAAVSTIVSERKSVLSASLIGGLWGVGHTLSLVAAGLAVILFHVQISERAAQILELVVAIMLVVLGAGSLRKLRRGGEIHMHPHRHGLHRHVHPHLHRQHDHMQHIPAQTSGGQPDNHHDLGFVARPLIVGMIHGVAGSAALMLLVLSTISSATVGFAYIFVFGTGSIAGMMMMSALVSLPARFTITRFAHAQFAIRCLAGLFSLGFGLFMVYEIGFAGSF